MKKMVSLILTCVLAVGTLAGCSGGSSTESTVAPADTTQAETTGTAARNSTAEENTEGSYTVVAKGMNGDISMTVTIEDGKIKAIEVGENSETPGIGDNAIMQLPGRIVEAQSLAVDTVSGATITSGAILAGVEQALTEAGLDVASFKEEKKAKLVQGENEETDVVIVGAGLAGLMAAYELKDDHPEVSFVVVEKLDMITGSLPVTGGAIISTDSELHQADNAVCSVEDIIDLFEYTSDAKVNQTLVSNVYQDSGELMDRLQSYGTNLQSPGQSSKYSDKVYAYWHENREKGFAEALNAYVADNGFDLRLSAAAQDLIVEDGKVVGVHVADRTQEYDIRARAVILATGGFGSSSEYMDKYLPAFADGFFSTNAGATGDGITMTDRFGTKVVGTGSMGSIVAPDGSALMDVHFLVNKKGERFIGEGEPQYVLQRAVSQQENQEAYMIADSSYDDMDTIKSKIEKGFVKEYDTLEELAEDNGMDADTLLATVEAYNTAADAGKEIPATEFALSADMATKVEKAPFYAEKVVLRTFGTIAGIEVNEKCQVLTGEGEAVDGLYAAGELIAGNAFTRQYPGAGVGISWAANTGRYAAEEIAEALGK